MEVNQLLNLTPTQLRRAAELKEQIDALNTELGGILGGTATAPTSTGTPAKKGGMSAAGRARIAAAARARWAKIRAGKGESALAPAAKNATAGKRRTMSPAARKRIAEAQKARWAKVKAAKGQS